MFSVAGSVIGAGFATGKELLLFFSQPDASSLLLLTVSVLLMSLTSVLYFQATKEKTLFPPFKRLLSLLFLLFSGGCYCIMLACGGEALSQGFHIPAWLGNIITCGVTLGILAFGMEGIYRFNLVATPLLMVAMLTVSIVSIALPAASVWQTAAPFFNPLIYAGYNIFSILPFLDVIAPVTKRSIGNAGIFLGFLLVLIAGIFIKLTLNLYDSVIVSEALPMMKITELIHPHLGVIYSIILYLAVLTTAVTCLYSCTKGKQLIPTALCLLSGSFFGFSSLLEKVYPAFGYIGIGIVILLVLHAFQSSKTL